MRAYHWLYGLSKYKDPRNATGNEPEHRIRLSPDTDSYNYVSMVEAQFTEGVTGALKAKVLYQQYPKGSFQENILSYYIAIHSSYVAAAIKSKEYFRMKNQAYQPTDFSDGYDKVGNAEAIVQYMHEFQNSGVHDEAPDTFTYNTYIGAYGRVTSKVNKDTPIKAKKVLRYMIHLCNNRNLLIAPDHRS